MTRPLDLDAAVARARELIAFADGLDAIGESETARRIRAVASDLADVATALLDERIAHRATRDERDELRALLDQARPNPFVDGEVER